MKFERDIALLLLCAAVGSATACCGVSLATSIVGLKDIEGVTFNQNGPSVFVHLESPCLSGYEVDMNTLQGWSMGKPIGSGWPYIELKQC